MALKRPVLRRSSRSLLSAPRGFDRFPTLGRLSRLHLLLILAGLTGLVLLVYLLSGQPLLLILAALIAGGGVNGLVQTNPTSRLRGFRDAVFYLFVPVLFTFGAGVFFRYTLSGWSNVPAALFSAGILAAVMYAEYHSIDVGAERFANMRLILNIAGYLAAFTLYTALYNQNLPLPLAAILVSAISFLIGIEVLHEVDVPAETLVLYAATLAFVMAEARWALNFISLSGWLAGVFTLIIFYVATQVLQSHLWGRLDRRVVIEFSVVSGIGALLVLAGRLLSG